MAGIYSIWEMLMTEVRHSSTIKYCPLASSVIRCITDIHRQQQILISLMLERNINIANESIVEVLMSIYI